MHCTVRFRRDRFVSFIRHQGGRLVWQCLIVRHGFWHLGLAIDSSPVPLSTWMCQVSAGVCVWMAIRLPLLVSHASSSSCFTCGPGMDPYLVDGEIPSRCLSVEWRVLVFFPPYSIQRSSSRLVDLLWVPSFLPSIGLGSTVGVSFQPGWFFWMSPFLPSPLVLWGGNPWTFPRGEGKESIQVRSSFPEGGGVEPRPCPFSTDPTVGSSSGSTGVLNPKKGKVPDLLDGSIVPSPRTGVGFPPSPRVRKGKARPFEPEGRRSIRKGERERETTRVWISRAPPTPFTSHETPWKRPGARTDEEEDEANEIRNVHTSDGKEKEGNG